MLSLKLKRIIWILLEILLLEEVYVFLISCLAQENRYLLLQLRNFLGGFFLFLTTAGVHCFPLCVKRLGTLFSFYFYACKIMNDKVNFQRALSKHYQSRSVLSPVYIKGFLQILLLNFNLFFFKQRQKFCCNLLLAYTSKGFKNKIQMKF